MIELAYVDAAVLLAVFLWLCVIFLSFSARTSKFPLPPGPKPIPLIGNMFDMPKSEEWETYTDLGNRFGEISFLKVLATPIVVLNSFRVADKLLAKRGTIYSGRPFSTMGTLAETDWPFAFMQYTPAYRARRRLFEQNFRTNVAPKYQERQVLVTRKMLQNFLETPDQYSEHIHHAMGSIILDIVYGYETKPKEDEWVALADIVVNDVADTFTPGKWLVDVIPLLRYLPDWMPGAGFKKEAKRMANMAKKLVNEQFMFVKRESKAGTAKSCIVSDHLEANLQGANIDERVIKEVAANAYMAGVDTMVGTLRTFVLHMVLSPDVQRAAQEEIDRVCPDRLVMFSDRQNLPYTESVFMEVTRYHPIAPQSLPRRLEQEDVFEGQRIPKGSVIIPNIWGMMHDENLYPSASTFEPNRFMKDGKLAEDVVDPRELFFGFGRRQCPGRALAESQVFISMANILKTFNIGAPRGDNGVTYTPRWKFSSGILSFPEPFKCEIHPRNASAVQLISQISEDQ